MIRILAIATVVLLSGCASLGLRGPAEREAAELWERAHAAYAEQRFDDATALFERLHAEHPGTGLGYESLFYLGAVHLDPRNPAWDPQPAAEALGGYLAAPFEPYTRHHANWPEAKVLQQLAQQLTMPVEERVPGLQPEARTEVVRVVVPAEQSRALRGELQQLREQLAERERELAATRAELERIRKTLSGK